MNSDRIQKVPAPLIEIISETLEVVRKRPEHSLLSSERDRIFQGFETFQPQPKSRNFQPEKEWEEVWNALAKMSPDREPELTFANLVMGELNLLTAEYVFNSVKRNLSTFELSSFERRRFETIEEILELGGLCLKEEVTLETGRSYLNSRYWFLYFSDIAYGISHLYCTAVMSLSSIVYRQKKSIRHGMKGSDHWKVISYDYIDEAVKAFSVKTDKLYRDWEESDEPVPFDKERRLEFWEWWLTEAIPHAWELAHSNQGSN